MDTIWDADRNLHLLAPALLSQHEYCVGTDNRTTVTSHSGPWKNSSVTGTLGPCPIADTTNAAVIVTLWTIYHGQVIHSRWDFSFQCTLLAKAQGQAGWCIITVNLIKLLIKSGHSFVILQVCLAQLQAICLVWPQTHSYIVLVQNHSCLTKAQFSDFLRIIIQDTGSTSKRSRQWRGN